MNEINVTICRSKTDSVVILRRRIDANISQQSIDHRDVTVPSSPSKSNTVARCRIDALISQQSFDDRDIALCSGKVECVTT